MDLRHLRYFLAVAQEGHFARAAERLNIVPPALSMQIRALEEELGGPLFVRTSRKVELTEAGRILQIEAQRTLEQAAFARETVQRSIRGETGCVRVGFAGNAVFSGKLTNDLRAFRKAYPDAELVVREVAPLLQADAILAGQLDVGYTPDNRKAHDHALKAEQIGLWHRLVAMADDHPLTVHASLTVRMLADESLIFYDTHGADESLYTTLTAMLGHVPKVAHCTASTLSVLTLAAAGQGLALVPEPLSHVSIPGLVYRSLDTTKLSANLMLLSRQKENNGAVNAFLRMARER
ncbi:LysR family transcriptional regulator [Salmonella enterica subsp. salamae]|uniref:StmR n=3 Tax=Salmonella enterica TaxID=28901 RepID=A0A379QRF3_SALER|nr:LysR substrate-binding domain-containing protein [Salmonella enterica]ECC1483017.1 LysR family transcriptional regulator [Salmonella enterica subsp. salamae]EHM1753228.1 LysR family transcriptional regulator [Salmonella enterica subsp. salamae serovar 40:c:e,n,x,z15]HCM2000128.1 LysR family transcriptional regulator [Salmonella enterica subsp. salamae serovar [1],40:z35:e,n,x,z15]ASG88828.1 LysR family transcriptional regulator [Salmonella enterica subsp. salamae serovar 55:k:z39 str. 1315K]